MIDIKKKLLKKTNPSFWSVSSLRDKKKRKSRNHDIGKKKKFNRGDDSDEEQELDLTELLKGGMLGGGMGDSIHRDGNHVYYYSEVSRDSAYQLNMLLKEAEEESLIQSLRNHIPPIPIYLHINSYGGEIYAALAVIDVIQSSRVPVYTICEGAIASAGTLISVCGNKRYMRPNAYLLIHQLSSSFWGKMNEIEDEYINLKGLMKKIKGIYKEHCKIPKKELKEILKHDLWWEYDKCLEYGLVDGLWTNRPEDNLVDSGDSGDSDE